MKTPVFVKVDQYDDLTQLFDDIQKKIVDAAELLEEIERLKQEEDEQLKEWASSLVEAKERANEIGNALGK